MKLRRIFLSIVVLLIVAAFTFSFFAGSIRSRATETQTQAQATPTPAASQGLSPFLQTVKDAMVESDDATENAQHIADAINFYNSLNAGNKIAASDLSSFGDAAGKLASFGIYFDEISSEAETLAWQLVTIDDGFATLK